MGQFHEEAKQLHLRSVVVDAHCDTILRALYEDKNLGELNPGWHTDLPKMRTGGVNVQVFAIFPGTGAPDFRPEKPGRALGKTIQGIDRFYRELERNSHLIAPAISVEDIENVVAGGKVAAILSVEGGEALEGSMAALRMLYRLGVRAMGLTWNCRNELADGVGEDRTGGGLTNFGVEVVREMNRLGMVVDVSHLGQRGFWDVMELSEKPPIASHSNCRAVCDHRRNLGDDQIKALAAAGGVMGMNFYPPFVHENKPTVDILLDHVDHVCGLVGPDHVGLGSDFDGFVDCQPVLANSSRMEEITAGLLGRGYGHTDVGKILGGNWMRVFRKVLR